MEWNGDEAKLLQLCQLFGLQGKRFHPRSHKQKVHWKMPLTFHWTISVKVHWTSDNPLENATDR